MSAHTPGPWNNVMCHIRTLPQGENFPNGRKLATVHIGPVGSDEAIANGDLMAAAPDLLEALKQIAQFAAELTNGHEILDIAAGAIARAEGRAA